MLCILCVFLQDRVRLRVGGRPCEPFPEHGLSTEPFLLGHSMCTRVALCELRFSSHIVNIPTSALYPASYDLSTLTRICYNSHVCRPTAASVFIYALNIFYNTPERRTLETVCVIDDKTKYSACRFPYFWRNTKSFLCVVHDWLLFEIHSTFI